MNLPQTKKIEDDRRRRSCESSPTTIRQPVPTPVFRSRHLHHHWCRVRARLAVSIGGAELCAQIQGLQEVQSLKYLMEELRPSECRTLKCGAEVGFSRMPKMIPMRFLFQQRTPIKTCQQLVKRGQAQKNLVKWTSRTQGVGVPLVARVWLSLNRLLCSCTGHTRGRGDRCDSR